MMEPSGLQYSSRNRSSEMLTSSSASSYSCRRGQVRHILSLSDCERNRYAAAFRSSWPGESSYPIGDHLVHRPPGAPQPDHLLRLGVVGHRVVHLASGVGRWRWRLRSVGRQRACLYMPFVCVRACVRARRRDRGFRCRCDVGKKGRRRNLSTPARLRSISLSHTQADPSMFFSQQRRGGRQH